MIDNCKKCHYTLKKNKLLMWLAGKPSSDPNLLYKPYRLKTVQT